VPADASGPVAVLAALKEEAAALLPHLEPMPGAMPGVALWQGVIAEVPTVLALTGVGKVSAAMATQFVCDTLRPRCLLSIGLAGATASGATKGRVIVAAAALQHDFDARPLTAARGVIPALGVIELRPDAPLSTILLDAAKRVVADDRSVASGLVLTGDQIITSRGLRDGILAHFPGGACFDMETAAIAQVAHLNGVPWAALRITSDAADEDFDLDDVIRFGITIAAETFEKVIRETLRTM
jgi:adenosylhomocysteine nucleosidase